MVQKFTSVGFDFVVFVVEMARVEQVGLEKEEG